MKVFQILWPSHNLGALPDSEGTLVCLFSVSDELDPDLQPSQ